LAKAKFDYWIVSAVSAEITGDCIFTEKEAVI
jgi:hypothetical protein